MKITINTSELMGRAMMARGMGIMFDGKRDVFQAAGYPEQLDYNDFYNAYRRQDVARRIVRAYPDETWRLAPEVLDGTKPAKGKAEKSDFVKAWTRIAQEIGNETDAEAGKGLLHYLDRIDRISGVGRYGVLLLGVSDGEELDQPLKAGRLQGPADLLYVSVFDEGNAKIINRVIDARSPHYGQPEFYNLNVMGEDPEKPTLTKVHWSRCIHIAEGLEVDDIYGTPRLEACYNRVLDLMKIMAGAGEAAWKLLDAGQVVTTKEGKKMPTKPEELQELEDQVDDFVNGLSRWLLAEGIEVHQVNGSVEDPTGLVDINLTMISAATGIPKRILMGSERGELASSQDESNWAKQVETRQANYVTPQILRPVIRRLIWAGILPAPSTGAFTVNWPTLQDTDRERDAKVAKTIAEAFRTIGKLPEPKKFVEVLLPDLTEVEFTDAPAPVSPFSQDSNGGTQPGEGEESEVKALAAQSPFPVAWNAYP